MVADAPLAGLAVLVVEDEFLIALEAQRMIEDAGADVVVLARSVAEARRSLAAAAFDVVVLDLHLGGEDAAPLADELRVRGIAFVIASGLLREHAARAALAGAPVIGKPYLEADLVQALVTALGKRPERPADQGAPPAAVT